jgi:two-component system LytT family response regulator
MKAIIVDDEPKAIELIEGYLRHFNAIELSATFRNGLKPFEFLNSNPVDLVFLDINMPHLSGIALSRMIPSSTKIIFTTAFSEYAAESYDVQALDYLLKPISFERFTLAMGKVMNRLEVLLPDETSVKMVKSGSRIYRLDPKDILYLQKDGNYMTYHLQAKKILGRESVAEALESLPAYFIQVHKSFIVNIHQIEFYNKEEVVINGSVIPIGDAYRTLFYQTMTS